MAGRLSVLLPSGANLKVHAQCLLEVRKRLWEDPLPGIQSPRKDSETNPRLGLVDVRFFTNSRKLTISEIDQGDLERNGQRHTPKVCTEVHRQRINTPTHSFSESKM